jgi:hypothetical protein
MGREVGRECGQVSHGAHASSLIGTSKRKHVLGSAGNNKSLSPEDSLVRFSFFYSRDIYALSWYY